MIYVIRNINTGRSWTACLFEAHIYCNLKGYQVEMGATILSSN